MVLVCLCGDCTYLDLRIECQRENRVPEGLFLFEVKNAYVSFDPLFLNCEKL